MNDDSVQDIMFEMGYAVYSEDHEWINVHDGRCLKSDVVLALIDSVISSDLVYVQFEDVPPELMDRRSAVERVEARVLSGEVRISAPPFEAMVFIAHNGVATAWTKVPRTGVSPAPMHDG
ncbi:hypothetical protein [Nitrogeniibacter aestuarii]|uniref:hypothetical protein n=1 Tax=Nitrogeniibacter aestuarii TaxID=2815343 RepID=UPI001D0FE535|nr:hypothetical protein [Nitrogeniibacter aestuarii]